MDWIVTCSKTLSRFGASRGCFRVRKLLAALALAAVVFVSENY